jgi:sRNA-binding carbon storage regulator CsrA
MLVLSREVGKALFVRTPDESFVITLTKLLPNSSVSVSIRRCSNRHPDQARDKMFALLRGVKLELAANVHLVLVDIRVNDGRFGIIAPPTSLIHRLEVWEALRPEPHKTERPDLEEPRPED